jgi:hypothetical protein
MCGAGKGANSPASRLMSADHWQPIGDRKLRPSSRKAKAIAATALAVEPPPRAHNAVGGGGELAFGEAVTRACGRRIKSVR